MKLSGDNYDIDKMINFEEWLTGMINKLSTDPEFLEEVKYPKVRIEKKFVKYDFNLKIIKDLVYEAYNSN